MLLILYNAKLLLSSLNHLFSNQIDISNRYILKIYCEKILFYKYSTNTIDMLYFF